MQVAADDECAAATFGEGRVGRYLEIRARGAHRQSTLRGGATQLTEELRIPVDAEHRDASGCDRERVAPASAGEVDHGAQRRRVAQLREMREDVRRRVAHAESAAAARTTRAG